jgi:hypothetical protein
MLALWIVCVQLLNVPEQLRDEQVLLLSDVMCTGWVSRTYEQSLASQRRSLIAAQKLCLSSVCVHCSLTHSALLLRAGLCCLAWLAVSMRWSWPK